MKLIKKSLTLMALSFFSLNAQSALLSVAETCVRYDKLSEIISITFDSEVNTLHIHRIDTNDKYAGGFFSSQPLTSELNVYERKNPYIFKNNHSGESFSVVFGTKHEIIINNNEKYFCNGYHLNQVSIFN